MAGHLGVMEFIKITKEGNYKRDILGPSESRA
jgi:hypothetical protein